LEIGDVPLKILILGTGGVGGFFGSLLARAGHDVTFVALEGSVICRPDEKPKLIT
jgi:pyruvate/2-oxoglutarate dehydrogenase complex dihydrolipoamide dehydrogenase (E3) component